MSRDGCVRCAPEPNHPELTGKVVGARTVVCLHASHLPYCHGDIPAQNVQHVSTQACERQAGREGCLMVLDSSTSTPAPPRRGDLTPTLMLTKCSASSRWRCGTGSQAGHSREWAHTKTSRPVPVASDASPSRAVVPFHRVTRYYNRQKFSPLQCQQTSTCRPSMRNTRT